MTYAQNLVLLNTMSSRSLRSVFVAGGFITVLLLTGCNQTDDGTGTSTSSASSSSLSSVRASSARSASSRSASSARSSFSSDESSLSSSRSSRAPFFSLQSSSDAVAQESVKVHVGVDTTEAQPGGFAEYIITIKNISRDTLERVQVVYTFSPMQMIVSETDGAGQAGTVQWLVQNLGPDQRKALRVRLRLSDVLRQGDFVTGNVVVISDATVKFQGSTPHIRIVQHLPATGMGDGTAPLANGGYRLRALHSSASVPAMIVSVAVMCGLGIGSKLGKKFL